MSIALSTVVHVIAQLRFGAGRVVVDTAVEQAAGLRHKVMVCVSSDADENWRNDPKLVAELEARQVEVRTIGDFFHRRTDLLHSAAEQLRGLCAERNSPVAVHAHTAMAAAVGKWADPDTLVATCHGWAANRSSDIDLQDSIAYQLCDKVLTYSRHWADRLSADLAVKNPLVISMGLNLERYPSSPTKGLFSDAPIKMVTVCELIPRKGVDILLNAMPAVWEHRPALELHIMGGGESEAELRSLAARFDPGAKRIIFHGTVPYPYGSLPDYDLFVLASRSDNLPVILLEAMLAKVPVVATSVGGVPELLAAAACGAIVAPENPRSLADGILGMLQQGRAHLAKLGKKGERFCRAHSDVKKTAWQLDRIYRDTLRHRRGSRSFRK